MASGLAAQAMTLSDRLTAELEALDASFDRRLASTLEFVVHGVEAAQECGVPVTQELVLLLLDRAAYVLRGQRELALATQVTRESTTEAHVGAGLHVTVVDLTGGLGYRWSERTQEAASSRLSFEWAVGNVRERLAELLVHDGADANALLELLRKLADGQSQAEDAR